MRKIKITVILIILSSFLLIGCDSSASSKTTNTNISSNTSETTTGSNSDTTEINKTVAISEVTEVKYAYYENARYGFIVEYPDYFTNIVESTNSDGITCTDKDNNEFKVWSGFNVLNYDVQQQVNISKKNNENLKLTSENILSNSYVLTWDQNDNIIYQYTIVGTNQISGFQLTYAKGDSKKYLDVIKHITETFKPKDTL